MKSAKSDYFHKLYQSWYPSVSTNTYHKIRQHEWDKFPMWKITVYHAIMGRDDQH